MTRLRLGPPKMRSSSLRIAQGITASLNRNAPHPNMICSGVKESTKPPGFCAMRTRTMSRTAHASARRSMKIMPRRWCAVAAGARGLFVGTSRSSFDAGYRALSYTIFSRYIGMSPRIDTDRLDLRRHQFRLMMPFSKQKPSFLRCVPSVIAASSHAKMFWIYAGRVVARVQDNHSFRDWTDITLINIAVGANANFSREKKNAISRMVSASHPKPTSFHLKNPRVKGLVRGHLGVCFQRFIAPVLHVMSTAQASRNCSLSANSAKERFSGAVSHGWLLSWKPTAYAI